MPGDETGIVLGDETGIVLGDETGTSVWTVITSEKIVYYVLTCGLSAWH